MDTRGLLEHRAIREFALFLLLLFVGFTVLPAAIFLVGQAVFGSYGGRGFAGFFGDLWTKVSGFEFYAWFLVLSPWLAVLTVRLAIVGWRAAGSARGDAQPDRSRSREV